MTPLQGNFELATQPEGEALTQEQAQNEIQALVRERAGYETQIQIADKNLERAEAHEDGVSVAVAKHNKTKYSDRLEQVDAEIERLSASAKPASRRSERR